MKADTIDATREWPADKVTRRSIAELIPYARNARTHSPEQVAQLAASIREWGWTIPVLIDEEGGIIAGHCRVMAAERLKITEIPCMTARNWTEAQKRAYILADNKLALNADWDSEILKIELTDLSGQFDGLIGFSSDELADIFAGPGADEGNYSRKIEAPIYEVTGERPDPSELIDRAKRDELVREINEADLPEDVRQFLLLAAERHTVFIYKKIAEFYAHAEKGTQELMERSALVIIDYNKAIEEGFVKMSETLCAIAGPGGDDQE